MISSDLLTLLARRCPTVGDLTPPSGVAGLEHSFKTGTGVGPLALKARISFHKQWRWPNEWMPSSLRSPNWRSLRMSPEISLMRNFSIIDSSNPQLIIQLATCRGVQSCNGTYSEGTTSGFEKFVAPAVIGWRSLCSRGDRAGDAAIRQSLCCSSGHIGDISTFKSDMSNLRLDEFNIKWPTSGVTSCETRNKCGPTGPSTAFGGMKCFSSWKLKVSYSWKLGVRSSSNDDSVVSLRLPNWPTGQCHDPQTTGLLSYRFFTSSTRILICITVVILKLSLGRFRQRPNWRSARSPECWWDRSFLEHLDFAAAYRRRCIGL